MTAESQRMPNKPVKQGYKIFSINDSKTGYTYWFSCAMRTSSMTIHDRILNLNDKALNDNFVPSYLRR